MGLNRLDSTWHIENDNETLYTSGDVAYEMFLVVHRLNDYVTVVSKGNVKIQEFDDDDENENETKADSGDKLAAARDDDDDGFTKTSDEEETALDIITNAEAKIGKLKSVDDPDRVRLHLVYFIFFDHFVRFIKFWRTAHCQSRCCVTETSSESTLKTSLSNYIILSIQLIIYLQDMITSLRTILSTNWSGAWIARTQRTRFAISFDAPSKFLADCVTWAYVLRVILADISYTEWCEKEHPVTKFFLSYQTLWYRG